MIESKRVENIRKHGNFKSSVDGWRKVLLQDIGFRTGEKAEYIIIAGCFNPEAVPHVFRTFKGLLDLWHVSYSLLPKENCCGNPIVQAAITAKNEEEIAASKELSREFILENFRQAEALGAKSIVLFCVGCEALYSICAASTGLEIITYAGLIERYFQGGRLNMDIDYYAGCRRQRKRITRKVLNPQAAPGIFEKIEGLSVNYIDDRLCCTIPAQLDKITSSVQTNTLVTACTGCHYNAQERFKGGTAVRIKMLPELVMESTLYR